MSSGRRSRITDFEAITEDQDIVAAGKALSMFRTLRQCEIEFLWQWLQVVGESVWWLAIADASLRAAPTQLVIRGSAVEP